MANTFKTTSYILDEWLVRFANQLQFAKQSYRNFEADFKNARYAPGQSIDYRLEENYVANSGQTATFQDRVQKVRTLTVDQWRNVGVQFGGFELTFDRAKDQPYLDEMLVPQARTLANSVEKHIAGELKNASYYAVGAADSSLSSANTLNEARGYMNEVGIPDDGNRCIFLDTKPSIDLANGVNNNFNPAINQAGIMQGVIGYMVGFDIYETIFLGKHTAGSGDGTAVSNGLQAAGKVKGDVTSGNSMTVDGLPNSTTGVFKKGDVLLIEDSSAQPYHTNHITGDATSRKLTLVVTADADSDGSGEATVNFNPEIITSGAYQNVSGKIPDNADVSIHADHDVSLAIHKQANVFAAPLLKQLKGGVDAVSQFLDRYKLGLTYTQGADVTNYDQKDRMDIIFGQQTNPEYMVRIMSKPRS